MNIEHVERKFDAFLGDSWGSGNIAPFLLSYIRLLMLFENELSREELRGALERQRQLREGWTDDGQFMELRSATRKRLDRDIGMESSETKKAAINRLLFCALSDSEESDVFYLTEPMFEFVRVMGVDPAALTEILESEFYGFKVDRSGSTSGLSP